MCPHPQISAPMRYQNQMFYSYYIDPLYIGRGIQVSDSIHYKYSKKCFQQVLNISEKSEDTTLPKIK